MTELLEKAKNALKHAENVTALTGAGVSAESGVPTFRGSGGMWKNFRPEQLAAPEAFKKDPVLVWEWYNWRRELIASKKPNSGHYALADMEKYKRFTLITQNVDGLHHLAGGKNILELHGSIWKVRCTRCGTTKIDRSSVLTVPPRCSKCNGLLRPDVVWFGESLDMRILDKSIDAALSADVFLVAGTSGVVQPAASLARYAKGSGAFVIEVNMEKTPISIEADVTLIGKAGEILPMLQDGWIEGR